MAHPPSRCISKASIRRLAHDVEQRLVKNSYECVLEQVEDFIGKILVMSCRIASFTKRKSISKDHIAYAVRSMGIDLPPELQQATISDLKYIQRCNIRAPSQQRKKNAMHAEISDAAFNRTVKRLTVSCKAPCRLNVPARHFLHLLTEQHIMSFFRTANVESNPTTQDEATAETLTRVLGSSKEQGKEIACLLTRVMNQVPSLLDISKSRTVDERLLLLALNVSKQPGVSATKDVSPVLMKVSTQLLRGRLMTSRITTGAIRLIANFLQSHVIQTAPNTSAA
uniref:Transcription factor CBF/NF-Y/archaeal histone domain-containing protein n=1 Tax=viral metagenome TaxID=1070528 RepID=A0A6C0BZQ8_9ZZZZ